MLSDKALAGNEVGWADEGVKCYNTNFGQVEIDKSTEELKFCVIGLGKNPGNTEISVKIFDNEFQVTKDMFSTPYAELCSKGFPYSKNLNQSIKPMEIFQILRHDNNNSIAAIIVKKELVKLIVTNMKLERGELLLVRELLNDWRFPIIANPVRTPIIIGRKSIRR